MVNRNMCLYPKLIKNRKYIANKKNGGNIPNPPDERVLFVPVGCGKCMECMKQKARQWQVRLHEEFRENKTGYFVTLSFSNEALSELYEKVNCHENKIDGYTLDNMAAKYAVRHFLENWRSKFGKSLRHWFVTELGQKNTERIHIHGIVWTNINPEWIDIKWIYGNTWIGDYLNEATINYIVKYLHKVDEKHKYYTPIILTSPGIGINYFNRKDWEKNLYKGKHTNELYQTRSGIKLPLPIYYRNHLYTDEEKEKLWLNLLDKQTRYVNGIKIDVSQGEEEYFKALEKMQIENKQLGYGDDKIDHVKKNYELELKNLKRLQILARAKRNNHIN